METVFSSEWDKFAKTYASNFGELAHGDITKISAHDIPDHDILLAGFPCWFFKSRIKKWYFRYKGDNVF